MIVKVMIATTCTSMVELTLAVKVDRVRRQDLLVDAFDTLQSVSDASLLLSLEFLKAFHNRFRLLHGSALPLSGHRRDFGVPLQQFIPTMAIHACYSGA